MDYLNNHMTTPCPHCHAVIEIDPETLAALQGHAHFECPACQGRVAAPRVSPTPAKVTAAANRPASSKPYVPKIASAHQGLNRNFLILGAVALLVLGGIGFFLASQKSGDTNTVNQNIHNEIINNSYFQSLIASGATTRKDLEAMAVIRPYENGFIGVSQESLEWPQSLIFARRAGGEVLEPGLSGTAAREKLMGWLAGNLAEQLAAPVWVQESGQARILDGVEMLAVTGTGRPRKTLLAWNLAGSDATGAASDPNIDPQRLLAESILSKGGRIKIRQGATETSVQKPIDLPEGIIELTEVDTYGTSAVFDDEDARLMEKCRHIRNIRLFNGSMTSLPFQSLLALESLEISTSRMDIASFKEFPLCQKLRKLNLVGMHLNGTICRLASQIAALEDIVIESNIVQQGDLVALSNLPRLRRLALIKHQITDDRILSELPSLKQLESLRLEGLDLPNADMKWLTETTKLQELDLCLGTNLSKTAWNNVGKLPALRTASFSGSNITDENLLSFSGHPALSYLNLNDSYVTGEGFSRCAPLQALTAIHIGLYKDYLTDAGIAAISRAAPNLEMLRTYGKSLTESAVAEIARCRNLKTLQLFDIPQFDDTWIPHLMEMKGLSDLALRSRFLTDGHVKSLGGLKESLIALDLQTAGITDACIDDLAGFKRLANLNLTETKISNDGLDRLRKTLPGCNIIR